MSITFRDRLQKQNCWEFVRCGREPGGEKATQLGICPASIHTSVDGLNGGKNGGRICWAISGTFCARKIEGFFAKKQLSCKSCIFFKKVKKEEGIDHYHVDKTGQTSMSTHSTGHQNNKFIPEQPGFQEGA